VGAQEPGEETWKFVPPPPPTLPPTEQLEYLNEGFSSAFEAGYSDQGTYSGISEYKFPVPIQNMQAQAVSTNFTGPDIYFGGSVVTTFNIVLKHTPH
jgi:hypothetical protein